MKTFTLTVLLLLLSVCSSQLHAQSSEPKSGFSQKQVAALEELKINMTDSTLSASFRDKPLHVSNIGQLDAYLKNTPELALQMKALIQSEGKINPEYYRSLVNVLNKNNVHNVRAISVNKRN